MGRKVSPKPLPAEIVSVTKLVHGGQGLAELADGRKVFVWNALPGETVTYVRRVSSRLAEPAGVLATLPAAPSLFVTLTAGSGGQARPPGGLFVTRSSSGAPR